MTGSQAGEAVQQAFFGWSYGHDELTLLAGSFDVSEQPKWRTRLQDFVRLQPVGAVAPPDVALSCLEFSDGTAAVVRRVNRGHSSGRTNAHVLIGPAALLGPPLALRLEDWSFWLEKPPNGTMISFAPAWFLDSAGPAEPPLDRIRPLAEELIAIAACLLERPNDPLSIVGCPDEHRLPVVWALRAATDSHLAERGVRRRWTFSTYEERHGAAIENLPEVVFLPVLPRGGEAHNRNVVEFGSPITATTVDLARRLVATLLHNAPAPEVPRQPVDVGRRPTHITIVPERVQHQGSEPVGQRQTSKHRPENVGEVMVDPLLGASSAEAFFARLLELSKQEERDQLREVFQVDAVNRAAELVEIDTRRDMLTLLLQALYGRDLHDLRSPAVRKHALRLVRGCRSDELVRLLGAGAVRYAKDEVTEAVFARFAQFGGPLKEVPKQRTSPLPWERTRQRRIVALASVGVLVLLLVFVGGYLAGRPSSARTPTTTSTTTVALPTTTAPAQTPKQPVLSSGTVALQPNQNQQVIAFVQVDDLYYPQGECSSTDGGFSWKCAQVYEPPGSASALVAGLLPRNQVPGQRTGVRWNPAWGDPVPAK